jgi:hypothetical protein
MPIVFVNGISRMVFEHLQNCFHPKDSVISFSQLFQFCSHITQGHIPCWITHILGAPHLLAMTKFLSGVRLFIVRETLYQFTSHAFMPSILWHLCNTFFPTPIQSSNQRWIWNNNPWHQMHFGPSPSPWLGCFLVRRYEFLQFGVKKGQILGTS